MDIRQAFIHWYFNEFQTSKLYEDMVETVEDSPHHRERNVGTHTDMVVSSFLTLADNWEVDILGAFACVFHDVGKPASLEWAHSEERGDYKRFHGHELLSARMWEHWSVRNAEFLWNEFRIGVPERTAIGFMVEQHLPWRLKNPQKRTRLAKTIMRHTNCHPEVYTKFLQADGIGRICDDDKVGKDREWVREFLDLCHLQVEEPTQWEGKVLYVPIAPSGAGKSTFVRDVLETEPNVEAFSWDSLRLEWYVSEEERKELVPAEAYRLAFQRSCDDSQFSQKAATRFIELMKTGSSVVVDNTNLTRKRRAFFVEEARRRNYRLVAVLFPTTLETLAARQTARSDKHVPFNVVDNQYRQLQQPQYGEFHTIIHRV